MTTPAKRMRPLTLLLLLGLALPAAAQQGTIEVQPLEPLNPDGGQSGDGSLTRPLEPLDEAEEGGFVRLPAPGSAQDGEPGLFSEGFDENAFGEEDSGGDGTAAAPAAPQGEVTEDGLWAVEEEDSLFGTDEQSGSGWMEPAPEAADDTAALIEEDGDDEPRFLVAPATGGGLFGPNRPRPLPQTATMPTEGAELRQLDKMTGAIRTVTLGAGEERQLGRLRVLLEGCHMPKDGGEQGTRAYVRIWDPLRDAETPVFSGWMFAESPALSALDHPRYDLWVLGCSTGDTASDEEPGEG